VVEQTLYAGEKRVLREHGGTKGITASSLFVAVADDGRENMTVWQRSECLAHVAAFVAVRQNSRSEERGGAQLLTRRARHEMTPGGSETSRHARGVLLQVE